MSTARQLAAPDHTSLWAIFVSIGVVLGIFAAIVQLSTWVGRWRFRDAEKRLLAAAATELNAEKAQRNFEKYQVLRDDLRRQVEEEVPREARRVFLRARRDMLASHLDEYLLVERELAALEQRAPTIIDHRLRGVIERSIRPAYARRRRTERFVVALLVLLVLSAASPWSLSTLIREYVGLMNDPAAWSDLGVVYAVAAGIAVSAGAAFALTAWWRDRTHATQLRRPILIAPAALVLVTSVGMLIGGLLARQSAQLAAAMYLSSDSVTEFTSENVRASVLMSASTPLVGSLLGFLSAALWSPRFVPERRGDRSR